MYKGVLLLLTAVLLCAMIADADACYRHGNSKWALHYAGVHSETNTCTSLEVTDCREYPAGQLLTSVCGGLGHYDIYVLALDTQGIISTSYNICCDPDTCFTFYGWTNCADFQETTEGWPGCGEGIVQSWAATQPAGHLVLGILEIGVGENCNGTICICGLGLWCGGPPPEGRTEPDPWCCELLDTTYPAAFGCVGFGDCGYNPCGLVPLDQTTWGTLKSLYR
jgi:hypothetical protein